jgi:PKD repeat protein
MSALRKSIGKLLLSSTLTILVLQFITSLPVSFPMVPSLSLTANTNKGSYYIREPVTISGALLQGGQPATDYLISVEVQNKNGYPLLFRTIPLGNASQRWPLEMTGPYITNSTGSQTSFIAINYPIAFNGQMHLHATMRNTLMSQYNVIAAATVFDGNLIPISADWYNVSISPGESQTPGWAFSIPEWAYTGKALATINVYNDLPQNGGVPYAPETRYIFYITSNPEIQSPYSVLPTADTSGSGQYAVNFRMPPDRFTLPGNYVADVTASSTNVSTPFLRTHASTSFDLYQDPSPPQAAFTYIPLEIYPNMTMTFDASSSSAEGYNDTIIQYEWTINDPYNPAHIIKSGNFTNPPSPTVTHVFPNSGTYTVQLNVTDNEGLWSTTSKPVTVLPEFGPTANFTWAPITPSANQTVVFDASNSTLGWSARIPGYAPIVNYTWNFGDGTPIQSISSSNITHTFTQPGNFTVGLTVTDSVGRINVTSQLIHVLNFSILQIVDLNGDGKIDMRDIAIVARAFGSVPGDPLWNPRADITGPVYLVPDGVVDMRDVSLVARYFGQSY